jgi:hypothetical protein
MPHAPERPPHLPYNKRSPSSTNQRTTLARYVDADTRRRRTAPLDGVALHTRIPGGSDWDLPSPILQTHPMPLPPPQLPQNRCSCPRIQSPQKRTRHRKKKSEWIPKTDIGRHVRAKRRTNCAHALTCTSSFPWTSETRDTLRRGRTRGPHVSTFASRQTGHGQGDVVDAGRTLKLRRDTPTRSGCVRRTPVLRHVVIVAKNTTH